MQVWVVAKQITESLDGDNSAGHRIIVPLESGEIGQKADSGSSSLQRPKVLQQVEVSVAIIFHFFDAVVNRPEIVAVWRGVFYVFDDAKGQAIQKTLIASVRSK